MVKLTITEGQWRHPNAQITTGHSVDFDVAYALADLKETTLAECIDHVRSVLEVARDTLAGQDVESLQAYVEDDQTLDVYKNPAVNIWGDIKVKRGNGYVLVSINRCTEYTSSDDIVDAVSWLLRGVNPTPITDEPQTTQYVDGAQRRPDGSADLKATFPRGSEQSQDIGLSNYVEGESDTPHIVDFAAGMREEIGKRYGGQVISVDITRFSVVTNKFGETEVEVYSTFSGGKPSKYAAYPLAVKSTKYIQHEETKAFFQALASRGIGTTEYGEWRGVYYVSVKGDKVYFNLNKIERVEDEVNLLDEDIPW